MQQTPGRRSTTWTGLRDARLDANLTWQQLAVRVGRTYRHVRDIEQGRVGASDELLIEIARVVKKLPSELIKTRPVPAKNTRGVAQRTAS